MYTDVKLIPVPESIRFINMSDEEYFSDKYRGYISNSKLALMNPKQGGSPSIYKEGLGKHQKFSDSLIFGSAVHELVLQPESFKLIEEVERPTAKMGLMADELFKTLDGSEINASSEQIIAASNKVDYYKDKMDDKKIEAVLEKCIPYWTQRYQYESANNDNIIPIYLDSKSREKLKLCMESVSSNKEIQDLLHPVSIITPPICMNEAALFMDVKSIYKGKEHILPLKAKLDNFSIDVDTCTITLNDLKTTGHWLTDFGDSFIKYRYNRQMAMYLWMLRFFAIKKNVKNPDMYANMLLVSTVPDFRAGIFKVSNAEITKGFSEMKDLLQRIAYCEITNNFEDGCFEI